MSRFRARAQVLCVIIGALLIGSVRSSGQATSAARVILQTIGLPGVDRGFAPLGLHQLRAGSGAAPARSLSVAAGALDRAGAKGSRYLRGRVIVKFRGGVSAASRVRSMTAVSPTATMSVRPAYLNADVVNIGADEDAESVARTFSLRDDVEYAQADYRVHPYFVPNDQYYQQGFQWNFKQINLERAWDIQLGGSSSLIVAVLDSGVAFGDALIQYRAAPFTVNGLAYPALGNIVVPFARAPDLSVSSDRFVSPFDFIWNDTEPVDLDGHGTHVTSTIGELTNNTTGLAGVAFNVKLMPVKVISGEWDEVFGAPNSGTDSVVAQGIRYATDNGAKIINMSIGRGGSPAPLVEDALNYAVSKGVFVAIAGGNCGAGGDGCTGVNDFEALADIANRIKGVVSVAAVDCNKSRAYYSTSASNIELAAPGGSDETTCAGVSASQQVPGFVFQQTFDFDLTETEAATFPGVSPAQFVAPRFDMFAYQGFEGTSMATPHVSGVAALLMSQGVTDPAAVEAALEAFATDLGAKGRDNDFGFGQIDARATLRGLGLAR